MLCYRDLHYNSDPNPHIIKVTDKELEDREKAVRARMCVISAQTWIDNAMKKMLASLRDVPGMDDWAQSLEELRLVSSSLSVLLSDRAVTDLGMYHSYPSFFPGVPLTALM